jgi:hypothetical protein
MAVTFLMHFKWNKNEATIVSGIDDGGIKLWNRNYLTKE